MNNVEARGLIAHAQDGRTVVVVTETRAEGDQLLKKVRDVLQQIPDRPELVFSHNLVDVAAKGNLWGRINFVNMENTVGFRGLDPHLVYLHSRPEGVLSLLTMMNLADEVVYS